MDPIFPSNRIPRNARTEAKKKHALKISDDSHNSILDEIIRRERLEYDTYRMLVGDEDEMKTTVIVMVIKKMGNST